MRGSGFLPEDLNFFFFGKIANTKLFVKSGGLKGWDLRI